MPCVLAIESSTPRASVAVARDGELIFEDRFESDRRHHSLIFGALEKALVKLQGDTLEAVIAGTGPGSYSGTRVGIAVAQGVALVRGCPAVGLSSLLALGETAGMVVGDARRGSAWRARLGHGLPEPELIPVAELAACLECFEGDVLAVEDVAALGLMVTVKRATPMAGRLVRAWHLLPPETRTKLLTEPPQPAYLRPPHVTEARQGHPLLRGK